MDIKAFINDYKIDLVIVLALFLFSFGLRAIPSQTYPSVYDFDPYWWARMTRTLIQTGSIPDKDPLSYWPEHAPYYETVGHLYNYFTAALYFGAALVTQGNFSYNENLFVAINNFSAAISGALGIVGIYILGRVLRNRKTGLFAGLLFSVMPTHLFDTMYGYSEEDGLGIAFMLFSFASYVWALKKGDWKSGLFAGFVLSLLLLTWVMVIYVSALLALFIILQAILSIIKKEFKELDKMTIVYGFSLIPLLILGLLYPLFDLYLSVLVFFTPPFFLLLLLNYWFNYRGKTEIIPKINISKKQLYTGIIILFLIAFIIAGIFKWEFAINTVKSYVGATGYTSKLSRTVGEEHPRGVENTLLELAWLAPFFLIGLFYLPLRALAKWKEKSYDILLIIFSITTFYMYIEKAKMGYVYGSASMLLVAVVLSDMLVLGDKFGKWIKSILAIAIVFVLFTRIGPGIQIMESYKLSYSVPSGWDRMYDYLKTLPNKDDVVMMTWWDYGHWSSWNNFKTTLDNTNTNQSKVIATAEIFTDFRGNTSQELEEKYLARIKMWEVTHIAIDRILLTDKWGALTFLGDNQCIPTKELQAYGLKFPQLSEISMQICGPGYTFSGNIGIANCSPKTISSALGIEKFVECYLFQDSAIRFSPEEWNEIANSRWPGYDLSLDTPQGAFTFKAYGQPDYKLMFFHTAGRILPDAPVNYMLGLRWFFKDPTLHYSKLIVNQYVPNEEVVLYKIDYE